jgi:hypothetical protein
MRAIDEYLDPNMVRNRFGSWNKALARAGIIRDPEKPPKIPAHIRATVKNVAGNQCKKCGADTTESRTGLAVEWAGDPPEHPDQAEPEDVVVVCDECGE